MMISMIAEKKKMSKVVIRSPTEEGRQDHHCGIWSEELKLKLMQKLEKRSQKHHQEFQRNSGKEKGKGFFMCGLNPGFLKSGRFEV